MHIPSENPTWTCVCGSLRPAVVLIRSSGLFVPSHLSESWRCQLRRLRCRDDVTFPPRLSSNNRGTAQPSLLPPPHAVIHTRTPAQIPEVCRRKKMEELHTQAEKSCFFIAHCLVLREELLSESITKMGMRVWWQRVSGSNAAASLRVQDYKVKWFKLQQDVDRHHITTMVSH